VTGQIATTMNITKGQAIASLAASALLKVSPRTTDTAAVHSSPPTGRT
jgi:hypothetical protein